jgi:hypothetical protein
VRVPFLSDLRADDEKHPSMQADRLWAFFKHLGIYVIALLVLLVIAALIGHWTWFLIIFAAWSGLLFSHVIYAFLLGHAASGGDGKEEKVIEEVSDKTKRSMPGLQAS